MRFAGFATLNNAIRLVITTTDGDGAISAPTAVPKYRVYGSSAIMTNGTGSLALMDTGSVTGATNASPIVISSASHGLSTGTYVVVASVGGNTAANGNFLVTYVSDSTFSLDGSTGNGAYTSGGTWSVIGLYSVSFTPTAANGFESGGRYTVLVTYAISGTTYTKELCFIVT